LNAVSVVDDVADAALTAQLGDFHHSGQSKNNRQN
jgi:hypothetical protein